MKPPVEMSDVVARLVDGLEGGEPGEEEVLPDEPRAIAPKVCIVGQDLDVDLTVTVHDVVTCQHSVQIANSIVSFN